MACRLLLFMMHSADAFALPIKPGAGFGSFRLRRHRENDRDALGVNGSSCPGAFPSAPFISRYCTCSGERTQLGAMTVVRRKVSRRVDRKTPLLEQVATRCLPCGKNWAFIAREPLPKAQ